MCQRGIVPVGNSTRADALQARGHWWKDMETFNDSKKVGEVLG